jgi:uncharacterized protein (DUF3084 family)
MIDVSLNSRLNEQVVFVNISVNGIQFMHIRAVNPGGAGEFTIQWPVRNQTNDSSKSFEWRLVPSEAVQQQVAAAVAEFLSEDTKKWRREQEKQALISNIETLKSQYGLLSEEIEAVSRHEIPNLQGTVSQLEDRIERNSVESVINYERYDKFAISQLEKSLESTEKALLKRNNHLKALKKELSKIEAFIEDSRRELEQFFSEG